MNKEKCMFLKELCENQSEIIKSIYKETKDVNYVLEVLHKQREITNGLGTTGEYTIAYSKNDSILFLLSLRQSVRTGCFSLPFKSGTATPMNYALSKNTGFINGLDYKGKSVLAYCTYIPELKWGLVTKMDISEVRLPFYKAGLIAIISTIILILISIILFRKVSRPITRRIDESEENYRRLFEYSAIPIWEEDYSEIKKYLDKLKFSGVTDFKTYFATHKDVVSHLASLIKVLDINQKSVEFFGADNKEDIIKNMLFYFNESSLEVFGQELTVLAEGGKRFECEMPIRTLSGDIRILDMHLSVVKGFESTLSNVLVSFIDITARKNNEERLILSRKEWIETFDLIPDMIIILDNRQRIVRANKAFTDKLGISKQDSKGLHCYHYVHGMQEAPSFCPHAMMLMSGKEQIADYYEEKFEMNMLVSITPIYDSIGNITGSVHISRDITERKRFENELEEKNASLKELNATKDKFFKIIAHDMKNPFISLLGASELLYENIHKYDINMIVKLTKLLNDSAKSGYDMLLNLLEWAKSQAGSMIFQPEIINLKELIYKDLSNLIDSASGKKINLNINIADNMQVYADKNMLNTILRNLINNALKFTPKGGEVNVNTKNENGSVIIIIKDTGIGIEKSDFDKLFRADIKFSRPGTDYEGGTGLGLLLCKELVEIHNGKIWLESETEKGSTFYFSLNNFA
ncbi:MAG: PAS domain-containing sensor histidine kinase [Bacteroidia bacterium]|nr:PAS domain-containing sensor histidine kinase [Bacteroidia bacterium]